MSRSPKPASKVPLVPEVPGDVGPLPPIEDPREYTASAFSVIRLEALHETDRFKADLVSVYRPANSQELAALERMAIAQQSILRAARLEAGLCASAMNEFCDRRGDLTMMMNAQFVGDGDIEITRAQNRNVAFAEGFQHMVSRSDVWTVFLRYQAQAERNYRRAVEEYERVRKLRGQLSSEPAPALPQPPREAPPIPIPHPPPPIPASEASPTLSCRTVRRRSLLSGWRQTSVQAVLVLITWFLSLLHSEPAATAPPLALAESRAGEGAPTAVSHPMPRLFANAAVPNRIRLFSP